MRRGPPTGLSCGTSAGGGWPLVERRSPLLAIVSNVLLAALSVSRILHMQRAAAQAAVVAMVATAAIACVPIVAAQIRQSRKVAANRKRMKKR